MKVNQPAVVPQQSAIDIAQAPGVAPSAAPAPASAIAGAASAPQIPHIPYDLLSSASAAAASSGAFATPSAAQLTFNGIPDDNLGMVAQFLPQEDQFELRVVSRTLKGVVERNVEKLLLSADEAVRLLTSAKGLPNLKTLELEDWDEADLRALAITLDSFDQPPFALRVCAYDLANLECLAAFDLSALDLTLLGETAVGWDALGAAKYPITLKGGSNFTEMATAVLKFESLTKLSLKNVPTEAIAEAIESHPSLIEFSSYYSPTTDMLKQILGNPRLQRLEIPKLNFSSEQELLSLSTHPSLTRLEAYIEDLSKITAISRNANLNTLDIQINTACIPGIRLLAEMQSLRSLTLHCDSGKRGVSQPLSVADIEALCRKSLDVLVFQDIRMDVAVLAVAVGANATTLCFRDNWNTVLVFDEAVVDKLLANPHVTSLEIYTVSHFRAGQAARVAASPTIATLALNTFELDMDSVKDAWVGAGKGLADLQLFTIGFRSGLNHSPFF